MTFCNYDFWTLYMNLDTSICVKAIPWKTSMHSDSYYYSYQNVHFQQIPCINDTRNKAKKMSGGIQYAL